MSKKKKKIILTGTNAKDKVVNHMKINSNLYNWMNFCTKPKEVLCRVENDTFFVVIPWSVEKKEFKGVIYEDGVNTYIEGAFYPLRLNLYYTLFFWGIVFVAMFVALSWIEWDIASLFSPDTFLFNLIFLGSMSFFCGFSIWLLNMRNEEYEEKILSFLEKSLNE